MTSVVEVERRKTRASTPLRMPGGMYVFDVDVLSEIPARGFHDIKQGLLERLHSARVPVHMQEVSGISSRIFDFESYSGANRWLIGEPERLDELLPGYERRGEVRQHPTALVHATARLIGPVVIGPNVVIEEEVVVVGPSSIGDGTIIESKAVISRSVIHADCVIGHGARVDASVLGAGARIPDYGHTTAEVRLGPASGVSAARTRRRPVREVVERPFTRALPELRRIAP